MSKQTHSDEVRRGVRLGSHRVVASEHITLPVHRGWRVARRPGVSAACAQSVRQPERRASCRLMHHYVVRTASFGTEGSGGLESNREQVWTIVSFK